MGKFWSMLGLALVMACHPGSDESEETNWSDEFDGNSIDQSKWTVIVGNGCPEMCGFGNNEAQYYTNNKENIRLEDGKLILEAHNDSLGQNAFTSAKIISKDKGDWQNGILEIRAKLPEGRGTWPAIWMLPTLNRDMKWPADGEIDIMEHVGYNPGWVYGTIHTEKYNHTKGTQKVDSVYIANASSEFHTFKVIWKEDQIDWFVDDQLFNSVTRNGEGRSGWPFDNRFHLIINLAIGGNWGGKHGIAKDIWPQRLVIDYVKVYKQ